MLTYGDLELNGLPEAQVTFPHEEIISGLLGVPIVIVKFNVIRIPEYLDIRSPVRPHAGDDEVDFVMSAEGTYIEVVRVVAYHALYGQSGIDSGIGNL